MPAVRIQVASAGPSTAPAVSIARWIPKERPYRSDGRSLGDEGVARGRSHALPGAVDEPEAEDVSPARRRAREAASRASRARSRG